MKASEKLISYIRQHEGFSATAYFDDYAGTPNRVEYSIGYGHQIQPNEEYLMNKTLTQTEAEAILRNDLPLYEGYVNKNVTVKLTQDQFDALVNLSYAAGGGAVIKSGLFDLINNHASKEKITEVWSKLSIRWKGQDQPALIKMRSRELELFFSNYKAILFISLAIAGLLTYLLTYSIYKYKYKLV